MLKNLISYIFIYIFLMGCDDGIGPLQSEEGCYDCVLELSILGLETDISDGYYHIDYNDGALQTFVHINAFVGQGDRYVGWSSDTHYCTEFMGQEECSNVVNSSSYSDLTTKISTTVMGVHEIHIGKIITIYCGYYNNGTQYSDSIKVIIDE